MLSISCLRLHLNLLSTCLFYRRPVKEELNEVPAARAVSFPARFGWDATPVKDCMAADRIWLHLLPSTTETIIFVGYLSFLYRAS